MTPSPPSNILIFVLGPPGAGKTTLCTLLKQTYNFTHVAAAKDPPASIPDLTEAEVLLVKQYLEKSELVPENIMIKFLESRVLGGGTKEGGMRVLVDGFPRSAAQFKRFLEAMKERQDLKFNMKDTDTESSIKVLLLVIDCHPLVEQERVLGRGRDVRDSEEIFQKRVRDYEKQKEEIVMAYKETDIESLEIENDENEGSRTEDVESMAKRAVVKLGKRLRTVGSLE